MPKKKNITKLLVAPLFDFEYLLIHGDEKHLKEAIKEQVGMEEDLFDNRFDGGIAVLRHESGSVLFIFFLRDAGPGLVAHEATHLANRIFESVSPAMSLTEETEEVYALLVEDIVDKVTEALKGN